MGVARQVVAILAVVIISFCPMSRSSCSFEPIGCYKDQAAPRTLRYHLDGCPTSQAWGSPEPPMETPAPRCDPKRVSIEYCASECAKWNPWAGSSTEFLVGLESGIGVEGARPDYAECLCDDVAHGPEASQILAEKPSATGIKCPAKCPGAEPGAVDQCGGAPGTWALSIYRVDCSTAWGLAFLITLTVFCTLYVAGGVGWSVKLHGVQPNLAGHPHFTQWSQVAGLVHDGIQFSSAQLKKRSAGSIGREAVLHAPLTSANNEADQKHGLAPSNDGVADTSNGADELVE